MVDRLLYEVDRYCEIPGNDIADVLMMFREFEHKAIRGLKDRFYKVYPYDYRSKMVDCLDVSKSKISDICNKK